MTDNDPTALFWKLAKPLLAEEAVTKGTMMGFPCLRVNGDFFASADHRSGDLVIKLPASYVEELIEVGIGQPFAPAGRRFREWVLIPDRDADRWRKLLAEARAFVEGQA
ncbi:MAG: hypothetical protein R3264_08720 [Anaerolineae bacterium]|nr:hypothetical protein [Anaerolineae bacterium]